MKTITLIFCVVALLGSTASTFFYFQIGDTKAALQAEIAAAQTKAIELEARLATANTETQAAQQRLASFDNDLGEAKLKLTAAENRSIQLARDTDQLRNQVTAKAEAEQALNGEVAQLKRELAQSKLTASTSISADEVETYRNTIATLELRIKELTPITTAPRATGVTTSGKPIIAASAPASPPVTAVLAAASGRVASVGGQNSFVVITIGSRQGIAINHRIAITRKGETIATALVSSVENAFSIAQVSSDSLKASLAKDDTVIVIIP
jgi:hypothetical protein